MVGVTDGVEVESFNVYHLASLVEEAAKQPAFLPNSGPT
jgi:hypothetical protein